MFVDEHPQPLPLFKILALKIKNAPRTQIVYDNFPKKKSGYLVLYRIHRNGGFEASIFSW